MLASYPRVGPLCPAQRMRGQRRKPSHHRWPREAETRRQRRAQRPRAADPRGRGRAHADGAGPSERRQRVVRANVRDD